MDPRQTAQDGLVVDDRITGDPRVVGHSHLIADLAVVGHMDVSHKQIAITHLSHAVFIGRSMDSYKFANLILVPDLYKGPLTAITEVLRRQTDTSSWIDAIILADLRPTVDHH